MLPSIPVQRKYLLLFNRQSRNMLKSELVPTPSKLSEEDVMIYFIKHLMQKGSYYVPKATMVLKSDEEAFRMLSEKKESKPRVSRAKKEISAVPPMVAATPLVSVIPPGPTMGTAAVAVLEAKRSQIEMLKKDANNQAKRFFMLDMKDKRTQDVALGIEDSKKMYSYYSDKLKELGVSIDPLISLKKGGSRKQSSPKKLVVKTNKKNLL